MLSYYCNMYVFMYVRRCFTCDHVVHGAHLEQHLLDEAHLGAGLQVAHALAEDGGEHAPDLRLARHLAVGQQLHHAADALRLLDDEVHLQVKLPAHQLEEGEERGRRGSRKKTGRGRRYMVWEERRTVEVQRKGIEGVGKEREETKKRG